MENLNVLVLINEEEHETVTKEELINILEQNDGDLERLDDYKDVKMVWGYLCKILDYHRYQLMDMDKVILFLDKDNNVYAYEHTGEYYPTHKEGLEVVGIMDENAEIEAV